MKFLGETPKGRTFFFLPSELPLILPLLCLVQWAMAKTVSQAQMGEKKLAYNNDLLHDHIDIENDRNSNACAIDNDECRPG